MNLALPRPILVDTVVAGLVGGGGCWFLGRASERHCRDRDRLPGGERKGRIFYIFSFNLLLRIGA